MHLGIYLRDIVANWSRRTWSDVRGSVIIVFAVALPVALFAAGMAIDYSLLLTAEKRLQFATDAATLTAARELHISTSDSDHVKAIATASFAANMGADAGSLKINTTVKSEPLSVEIEASRQVELYFMASVYGPTMTLLAKAVARVEGGTPICVLGLNENSRGTIAVEENARLTGNNCAVYSNSTLAIGLNSKDGALIQAELICSAGGVGGGASNYEPQPLTDCPVMEDPLANRPSPQVGSCSEKDLVIGTDPARFREIKTEARETLQDERADETDENASANDDLSEKPDLSNAEHVTLSPGVYCGGLIIGGTTDVTLLPGIYVIKNGPLYVADYAAIHGTNVGFYLTGDKAFFQFGPNTTVSLSAPEDGRMAGLLFFEDHASILDRRFSILSDNARVLVGTIYLSRGILVVDADKPVADKSAYTAIIARRLRLYAGPNLVMNTNYDETDVPVPAGVDNLRTVILTD